MKPYLSALLLFLAGLSLLLYPVLSDLGTTREYSQVIADYRSAVSALEPEDRASLPENAHEAEDWRLLDICGTGMLGWLTIPKISVELPVYHGTSEEVLLKGAGLLECSSLPIGGESTHSVLSAHRGLPSARLFTDLDKLEPGDTFTITVLDRQLTYEVEQILVVEPRETDALAIVEGADLCTLVTCTPYGINSHRLLVRGRRLEAEAPS